MRSFALRRTLLNIVAGSAVFLSTVTVASAQSICKSNHHKGGYTGSIVVKGSPAEVFAAIKNSRNSDRRKIVSSCGNSVVLEEKFAALPIIGAASCKYKEVEVPHKRIDYSIVHSKQFKQFEGKWELIPVRDGKSTEVRLTSRVEAYIKVPFSKRITDHSTKRDIKRRLIDIKCRVESSSKRKISFAKRQ